jgi:hypothetical protein
MAGGVAVLILGLLAGHWGSEFTKVVCVVQEWELLNLNRGVDSATQQRKLLLKQ